MSILLKARRLKKRVRLLLTSRRGMSLLEVLAAFAVLAFIFVFMTQISTQSYRYAKKIRRDIHSVSSLSNVLDLMRRDFLGLSSQLDIKDNFNLHFSVKKEEEGPRERRRAEFFSRAADSNFPRAKVFPVFLSPYFVLEGSSREMSFSSYSFSSGKAAESFSPQWIKIHYHLKSCGGPGAREEEGSCLVRSSSSYWNPSEKEDPQETLILIRGLDSLEFSYASGKALADGEWKDEYKPGLRAFAGPLHAAYPRARPFPSAVKMAFKKKGKSYVFFFPVSFAYLRNWNPYDKAYLGFPEWSPPEKPPAKKEGRNERRPSPGRPAGKEL